VKQLIVVDIDTESKVEPGIPFVNDLEVMQLILLNKSTSKKLVCLESLMTIILWIYDWSLTFSLSS